MGAKAVSRDHTIARQKLCKDFNTRHTPRASLEAKRPCRLLSPAQSLFCALNGLVSFASLMRRGETKVPVNNLKYLASFRLRRNAIRALPCLIDETRQHTDIDVNDQSRVFARGDKLSFPRAATGFRLQKAARTVASEQPCDLTTGARRERRCFPPGRPPRT